jgi:hypothetical protein
MSAFKTFGLVRKGGWSFLAVESSFFHALSRWMSPPITGLSLVLVVHFDKRGQCRISPQAPVGFQKKSVFNFIK